MLCRVRLAAAIWGAGMVALGARLAVLHVGTDWSEREKIERTVKYTLKIPAPRGSILDRRGDANVLALDITRKDVCIDPRVVATNANPEELAAALASALGMAVEDIANRIHAPGRSYVRLKRFADEETVNRLKTLKLPGVFFADAPLRFYPHGESLCHVLGFVNHDGVGSAGVELTFNEQLRGVPGLIESKKDAHRRELYWKRDCYLPPVKGVDVFLTVDQNLQHIVERVLDGVIAEHHAKAAWAIVQRVRTGEILAMASRPAFDPNEFRTADTNTWINRTISCVYEPGSTMKAAAIAAALNEGVVTADTVLDCENGAWMYKNRVLRDYHPYGRLTVADGVQKSSNILTAKVAVMLGESTLYRYLRAFGFGSKTGVKLPGEESGILRPLEQWSGISITRIPIGQGVAVTALQMLNAFCAIANDGYLMRPYIVSKVRAADGSIIFQQRPEVLARPIRPETAALMRKLLTRVTEQGGTGKRAAVEGYTVAGKTGTAQKPVAGGYSSTDYVASFVGFLPAEAPEIGLIVVVDEPQPFHTGGVVAGPAFSRIASQAVRYLDISPVGQEAIARR